jgi:threonine 3-dehydrogenase
MYAVFKDKADIGLNLRDAPEPVPTDSDVLLKVKAASICGTDVGIYNWIESLRRWITPPVIIGHEFAGEVVEVGKKVKQLHPGDIVAVESRIACGECYQCNTGAKHLCSNLRIIGIHTNGGFAQYAAVPKESTWKLGKGFPIESACMMDALGLAVHATLEEDVCGYTVVIFGSGPTGILAGCAAKAGGAQMVIMVGATPYRLDLAKKMCADHTIYINDTEPQEAIMEITKGEGVDLVLEMSGAQQAINVAFAVLKKGGRFVAFGIPRKPVVIDWTNELIMKGIRIRAIIGRKIFHTWYKTMALLNTGKIDPLPLITHKMKLTEYEKAFELLKGRERNCGKIMFEVD